MIIPIILSGGSGTRLWPISSYKKPKQFVNFIGNKTLFSQTIERVSNREIFLPPIVLGNAMHRDLLFNEININRLYDAKIILEPEIKNTAPAIMAAVEYLYRTKFKEGRGDDLIVFIPSDAYVDDNRSFEKYMLEGEDLARNRDIVVCFGVQPKYPETGYGYIRTSGGIGNNSFMVEKFVEKPNLETAVTFLEEGEYLWNAGIFMSRVSVLYDLFSRYSKKLQSCISTIIDRSNVIDDILFLDKEAFSEVESVSIDYALMEHLNSTNLAVVSMDIIWSDLGSYKSLHLVDSDKTNENNVVKGRAVLNNTVNCYIKSDKKIICCSDVEDLVVVEEDSVILILKKDMSQNVKNLIEIYKREELGICCNGNQKRPAP